MKNIRFKGLKNTRDLGGIKTKNGVIKEKKLLRGAGLAKLTPKDVDKLVKEYNLNMVIDLRTIEETFEKPDIQIPNVKYYKMPIFTREAFGITHESNQESKKGVNVDLKELYTLMFSHKYLENIAKVIRTILSAEDENYSILFHCTEGKDRTGIVTAMLLLVLGVDRQIIMEDYLYTNKVNAKKANRYYWTIRLLKRDKERAKIVRSMYIADRTYLQAAFDYIDNNWEDLDDFIQNGLKIEKELIEKFEQNVVEK